MDFALRIKALLRLARSESEEARATLRNELNKAITKLQRESEYDRLEEALSILEVVGGGFSSDATAALVEFITDIESRNLVHLRAGLFGDEVQKYQSARTLVVRAVEVLLRMRYLETVSVFWALMGLASHEIKEVGDKAINGLKTMAHYDLHVFYGDKTQRGIGAEPQLQIVKGLEQLSTECIMSNFTAVLAVSDTLLSPTIEGRKLAYKTLTLSHGTTPAIGGVEEVRAKTVDLLKRLYHEVQSIGEKLRVIAVLNNATKSSRAGALDEGTSAMLTRNTVHVLCFYEELASTEPLQLLEQVESNAYWIYYHSNRSDVETAAFRVRDSLERNSEYQIYKTLIGFEGVFGEWGTLRSETQIDETDRFREAKALEFANSINAQNYPTWRTRILEYIKTESDDLATFQVFYKFLEEFAVAQPSLAYRLVSEDAASMASFLVPIFRGLWAGPLQEKQRGLLMNMIGQGLCLRQMAAQFFDNQLLDKELLDRVLSRAVELKDELTVSTVLSVVVSNYKPETNTLIRELFSPALRYLTDARSTQWIFDFWFRREIRQLIPDLTPSDLQLVLENLLALKKIDYHAEEILYFIALKDPGLVLEFLCERLKRESAATGPSRREFEAIPYTLHKLQEPLGEDAEAAVNAVSALYDGDYGMFVSRGARLLRIIFPAFPLSLSEELLRLVRKGGERNLEIVLAVLRTYEGPKAIQEVCRAIIKGIPQESELKNEVAIALQSTGLVAGEYGLAEAYERKAQELCDWLNDSDEKVQDFAREYINSLEEQIEGDRKHVDEEIALRKHQYGE